MLEEYARPELGDYDDDSGQLVLDIKKVLIDNNSKLNYLKDLENELELSGD